MNSRLLFRESGYPIQSASRWADRAFIAAAIVVVVLVLGRAAAHDQADTLAYEARMRAEFQAAQQVAAGCPAVPAQAALGGVL